MGTNSDVRGFERMISLMMFLDQRDLPAKKRDIETSVDGYAGLGDGQSTAVKALARDIENLESIGVFVDIRYLPTADNVSEALYSLNRDKTFSTGISLSSDELLLLRFASLASLNDPSFPYGEALRSAITKLSSAIDVEYTEKLPDPRNTQGSDQMEHRMVSQLEKACRQRKLVGFSYCDAGGNKTRRKVEPYTVYPYEGCWYLVCFDLDRDERRVFRVKRMSGLKQCTTSADADFTARDIDTSDLPVLSFSIGPEEPFEVSYLIPRTLISGTWNAEARVIRNRATLEEVEGHPDLLLMKAQSRSTAEAARWALCFAPGATVLAPQAVIDAYEEGLAKVVSTHE